MKKLLLVLVLLSASMCYEIYAGNIEKLNWLEGHWKGVVGKNSFEAIYSGYEGGRILSISKEIRKDGSLVFAEFEEFRKIDGKIRMTPFVNGKKLSVFTLTGVDNRRAVFENLQNDFPSRIVYYLKSCKNLVIILTGAEKGKTLKVIYNLKRVE